MKKIALTGLALVATVALGFVVMPTADANAQAGMLPYLDARRTAEGAAVYAEYCASCHGADLEGEPDWRVPDADGYLPAPPHDETGHTWHHPDGLLIDIVTRGTEAIVGGTYKSNMMGFGDVLSPAEIESVLAYIKSTWPSEVIEIHNEINARTAESQ